LCVEHDLRLLDGLECGAAALELREVASSARRSTQVESALAGRV
jgi:hypothetical protein